ncbi:hypothetical protein QUB80_16925 [Chlorogloeopsis sp. ULAP01]|nr:hypothetical protein [Chlorogloeopsis sp. ULAP01]MDM9382388.1 hypothetical protein [Chlorogloeopsis sp. ULAP01]
MNQLFIFSNKDCAKFLLSGFESLSAIPLILAAADLGKSSIKRAFRVY